MMATTHALAGAAVATVMLYVAPEYAAPALVGAMVGGLFPDLDLYAGHRKTLHFPVYFTLAATVALGVAALAPGVFTVGVAFFLVAAALHSLMDALGGGLELKPWEGTSQQAVYDHYNARWIRPRRWVRYDGAPEDLVVAAVFAVPTYVLYGQTVQRVVLAVLGLSAGYALVRKPMVAVGQWLFARLPATLVAALPERFVEDLA